VSDVVVDSGLLLSFELFVAFALGSSEPFAIAREISLWQAADKSSSPGTWAWRGYQSAMGYVSLKI